MPVDAIYAHAVPLRVRYKLGGYDPTTFERNDQVWKDEVVLGAAFPTGMIGKARVADTRNDLKVGIRASSLASFHFPLEQIDIDWYTASNNSVEIYWHNTWWRVEQVMRYAGEYVEVMAALPDELA